MTLRNLMESSTLSLSSSLLEKRSHQVPMQWLHMSLNILPIRSVSRMRKGSMYPGTRPVGNLCHSFSGLLLLESLKRIFVAMLSNFYPCLFNQAVLLFFIFVSTTKKKFMQLFNKALVYCYPKFTQSMFNHATPIEVDKLFVCLR